ncbi:MAG TPA: 2,3-diphosphoglycerate-dependent phosphoglycerate mutase [Acidimicrobiales bacterium]|jgi:2,3-bisphosphoglycerate-dependent phosphoglycerate mutase|nr:2,3-diphosphoglycerate-dependent phosphoglycerate mutase [Acidimicrobiales bacterium]
MSTLVLLRHGESTWNAENLFTGWWDCPLSDAGEAQAAEAGRLLAEADVDLDVLHTSVLTRAIQTAQLALAQMGRPWLPVRRHWRLNERHYGDLTGRNKAETAAKFGADQVKVWRRSYDVPPPPIAADNDHNPNDDRRYRDLAPDVVPGSECLADVVDRMLPYWFDAIVPDLVAGRVTLVVAHGNSLRALVKHLDRIGDDEIAELNIPTGVPFVYELGPDFRPLDTKGLLDRALGDVAAAKAAAEAVANQAKA